MYGEPEAHATRRQAPAKTATAIAPATQAKTQGAVTGAGCSWVIQRTRQWDPKKKQHVLRPVFCHRLPAVGSHLCPRHQQMAEWTAETQSYFTFRRTAMTTQTEPTKPADPHRPPEPPKPAEHPPKPGPPKPGEEQEEPEDEK